mmetsp:Transcript_14434/g.34790  ORF Transcript_14434/g.34790 Transcript_14434/m.34790 type:complete len:249 (-) Transcript_14434:203-949(-)
MASNDPWIREFDDAEQLLREALGCVNERAQGGGAGVDVARQTATARRKQSSLNSKIDRLQALLQEANITERESRRREDLIGGLRRRSEELGMLLSNKNNNNSRATAGAAGGGGGSASGSRGDTPVREMEQGEVRRVPESEDTAALDNRSILQLQRNLMQDQDDELDELSRVVTSTKHLGLAVGEELDLHARLLDDFDDEVGRTSARLRRAQKMAKMVYEKSSDCKLMICGTLTMVVLVLLIILIVKKF